MAKVKVKSGEIFERKELKYLLSKEKYNELLHHLQKYMEIDEYGLHTIHTVYFDTEDLEVIRHSVSKPRFKEKLRLRSYGTANKYSPVFLELKKKVAGITYKRRVKMAYQESQNFFNYGSKIKEENQIFKEIDWYRKQYKLQPIVRISYDRLALKCPENENFRITFDHQIRYSLEEFDLDQIDEEKQIQLMTEQKILMEVKVSGAFPLEISQLFSDLSIFQEKFTKYGNVYHWILFPKWEAAHTHPVTVNSKKMIYQGERVYV